MNTVFDAKRLIGRRFDDESVQKDMKNWPFTVKDADGKPKITAVFKGENKVFAYVEVYVCAYACTVCVSLPPHFVLQTGDI